MLLFSTDILEGRRDGKKEKNNETTKEEVTGEKEKALGMAARKRKGRRPTPPELTLEELNQQLDAYSERVSNQVRTINLGVLSIVWLLLLKQPDVERIADRISERGLLCLALACIVVFGLDILQYKFAERAVEDAFGRAEQSSSKKAAYYEDSFDYQAQIWCYRLKLLLTGGNALGLLVLVGYALSSGTLGR